MSIARVPDEMWQRGRPVAVDVLWRLATLFVIAVPLNYLWELGESPLYAPPGQLADMLWHCFVASLGDGVLVGAIYVICAVSFRQVDWYVRMSAARYAAMLSAGITAGVLVEWAALWAHRWTYADAMPLLPALHVGLVPVLQMLVLPPLIFLIAKGLPSVQSTPG